MTINRTPLAADGGNPRSEQGVEQQNTRKKNRIIQQDSQSQILLAALQNGPVGTPAAIYGMEILHPSSALHLLRLQGHNLETVLRPVVLPDGRETWCAEYHLLLEGVSLAGLIAGAREGA